MEVNINPKVMSWARKERGFTIEEVSKKLKTTEHNLKQWEINGRAIPFQLLELIAKQYKRQTAVFFLPTVPPATRKVKDFRNLSKGSGKFSPDVLLAIRRTERYLQVMREVNSTHFWNQEYGWIREFSKRSADNDDQIELLKKILIPVDELVKFSKNEDAFRYWRTIVEEMLGVFVFQFSMPEKELDGFSYAYDKFPYAIVINNKKSPTRKIFTLFHELAHIIRHNTGLCHTDVLSTDQKFNIELECNNFAGKLLVPSQKLVATDSIERIFKLARQFNVSGEVYLRRLFNEDLVTRDSFYILLDEVRIKALSFKKKKKKQEGGPSMIIQSRSTRGKKFYETVVNAAAQDQLTFSLASDLLGLKVGSIKP